MSTIKTDQPSTGKPVKIALQSLAAGWNEVVEANNFSIPLRDEVESVIDTDGRQIVSGELFFSTPLLVTNLSDASRTVRCAVQDSDGLTLTYLTGDVLVPVNETVFLPIQGQSVFHPAALGVTVGDKLLVWSDATAAIHVYGSATESEQASHAPNTDLTNV